MLSSTKTFVCSNWKGKKSSILVLCFVSWEARKTYILKEGAYLLISQLFNSDMTHQSTQLWWYCNWIFLLFLETFIALFVFCALIVLTLKRNLVSWKYCGHLNKEIISFFPSWFCVVCVMSRGFFNPFHTNLSFQYSQKTLKKQRFCYVFWLYRSDAFILGVLTSVILIFEKFKEICA